MIDGSPHPVHAQAARSKQLSARHVPRALIISASAGTGHVSAGRALHAAFNDAGYENTLHVDILELAPRWVRAAYGGGFELLASHAPALWREVYRRSDGTGPDEARWGAIAQKLMFREFQRLLSAQPWTFCVCTHFLPAQLAAGRAGTPPFVSVVTDFTLHRYWVQPRVRQYFVATPALARELHARLPVASVVASGIPVAAPFSSRVTRHRARATLGLTDGRRIALVMGGGLGIGVDRCAIAALDSGIPDLQVIAVCGRNDAARQRLAGFDLPTERLRVLGYADDVATLIAAADVVVTKPGGLTCSEALAVGRPLVLTRALPGHEEGNVSYLASCGAAIAAPAPADVAHALRNLLLDRTVLDDHTVRARDAGVPGAARSIAAQLTRRFTRTVAA